MKVPVVDSLLNLGEEILEMFNNAEYRRRTKVIRSADKLIEALAEEKVLLKKKSLHYYEQYKIRRSRLT